MMGSWFSNISIRKKDGLDIEAVKKAVCGIMAQRNYLPADSEEDADEACAILSLEGSQWFTVCSGVLGFEEPEEFSRLGLPVSKTLNTDVLGISCFDSDYIYLNLLNAAEKVDAWAGVGVAAVVDITRRTNLPKWESKVANLELFKKAVKGKYVFAEEVLGEVETCLGLPKEQSQCSLDWLNLEESTQYLYFKRGEEQAENKKLPQLIVSQGFMMPCYPDRPEIISCLNVGGESKGWSVYFVGSYVEHDELKITDVSIMADGCKPFDAKRVELEKVQLSEGQWAYRYHDPEMTIPAKVDEGLPPQRRYKEREKREITVRFVPRGSRRKALDVTVVFVPDENPIQGQAGWNVWFTYGSKEGYIEDFNKCWSSCECADVELLCREDFD